jgi:hypothetical protein
MPMKLPKQEVITLEKPFGGWAPQKGSASFPVEGSTNPLQYTLSEFIDLHRDNFEGHLAPGQIMTPLSDPGSGANSNNTFCSGTNVVNGLPVSACAFAGEMSALLNNYRIVNFDESGIAAYGSSPSGTGKSFDPLPFVSGALNITNHVSSGGSHAPAQDNNGDTVFIYDGTGNPPNYMLYSWDDSTDGDVGLVSYTSGRLFSANTPNWLSQQTGGGVLTTGVPHKLCKGTDGNVYVTNGNTLVQIQIATTHIYNTVPIAMTKLTLGYGWTATHLINYQGFLIIIGYNTLSTDPLGFNVASGNARIWWWNYGDPNPSFVFDLDEYYGDALFADPQGTLYAFTHGKDGNTSIWEYNGSQFQKIYSYLTSQTGIINVPSGVDTYNSLLTFTGMASPGLVSLISQWDGTGFHQPGCFINSAYNATGFLKNLDTKYGLYLGIGTSGSPNQGAICYLNGSYSTGASLTTLLNPLPRRSRVTQIKLYFSQFGTVGTGSLGPTNLGAAVKVSLYSGYDQSTDLVNNTVSYYLYGSITEFTIPCQLLLDSFYLIFNWKHANTNDIAAIIRKVEITYEQTDFPL